MQVLSLSRHFSKFFLDFTPVKRMALKRSATTAFHTFTSASQAHDKSPFMRGQGLPPILEKEGIDLISPHSEYFLYRR